MLTLKNLSLTAADAQGRADIVKNVSLDVEDGKFLVITGPNGGGKTTLAKLIMGLATPTGGQIFLDGEDITGLSIFEFLSAAAPVQGHEGLRPSHHRGGQGAFP